MLPAFTGTLQGSVLILEEKGELQNTIMRGGRRPMSLNICCIREDVTDFQYCGSQEVGVIVGRQWVVEKLVKASAVGKDRMLAAPLSGACKSNRERWGECLSLGVHSASSPFILSSSSLVAHPYPASGLGANSMLGIGLCSRL